MLGGLYAKELKEHAQWMWELLGQTFQHEGLVLCPGQRGCLLHDIVQIVDRILQNDPAAGAEVGENLVNFQVVDLLMQLYII